MRINLKEIKVYLISPGVDKYAARLSSVHSRLVAAGFKHIEFTRALPGSNGTDSLARTNIAIMEGELVRGGCRPFIIFEDDVAIFHDTNSFEVPEDADAVYLGVSKWIYPHGFDTLGRGFHIRQNSAADIKDINSDVTQITGMTGGHGILFMNPEFLSRFIKSMNMRLEHSTPHDLVFATLHKDFNIYALKSPFVYQDASLGGQEAVTRLVYNGTAYI
jgi:hypothetical protein